MKNNENIRDLSSVIQVETLIEINQTLGRVAYLLFIGFLIVSGSILGLSTHLGPIHLVIFGMFIISLSIALWLIERAEKKFRESIFKKLKDL